MVAKRPGLPGNSPGGLFGGSGGGLPGRSGRLAGFVVIGTLLLALAGAGTIWYLNGGGHHDSLGDATLVGTRQSGVICLDVAGDFSASMDDSIETRDAALALLKPFMTHEMRPDDVLTSVAFAKTASLTLPPTRVADLAKTTESRGDEESGGWTYFIPALEALDRGHRKRGVSCSRRVLVAITDGEFADGDMGRLVSLLHHFDRIYLAVPDERRDYRPTPFMDPRLAAVISEGFDGPDALSLLYGKALASATGQQLARKPQ